ncbi:MAG: phosphoenolpyruvate--protein phosphotransferase, partial [Planctomycetaceae bacterium]|nr:phosphoenolpyruvate--protein phosphotransferase [Planctomycetaceae bacterium]
MKIRRGIAVSPGIAIGPAFVLGAEEFRIPHRFVDVDAVETEVERFRNAIQAVADEVGANQALAAEHLGKQYGAIFGAHLQLIQDPKLAKKVEKRIRERHQSPEYAVSQVLRDTAKELQNLGNPYLAERAADMFDLERSLLRSLLGQQRGELSHLTVPVVVLAHNLTPSETASLNRDLVQAFVTEVGGSTSHTAILAGALEIPAVVGVGDFLTDLSGGETVIVDGDEGRIFIDPDAETLKEFQRLQQEHRQTEAHVRARVEEHAETKDGQRILVFGNIEFPEESQQCQKRGADGIGLYRTEFLYLGSTKERTEEDHYQAYLQVVRNFPGQPVTIRTLDLGADKIPGAMRHFFRENINPELGLRSIRVSLEFVELFKIQLRAILRVATEGDVRVMFPLISSLAEFRQAKMIFRH